MLKSLEVFSLYRCQYSRKRGAGYWVWMKHVWSKDEGFEGLFESGHAFKAYWLIRIRYAYINNVDTYVHLCKFFIYEPCTWTCYNLERISLRPDRYIHMIFCPAIAVHLNLIPILIYNQREIRYTIYSYLSN